LTLLVVRVSKPRIRACPAQSLGRFSILSQFLFRGIRSPMELFPLERGITITPQSHGPPNGNLSTCTEQCANIMRSPTIQHCLLMQKNLFTSLVQRNTKQRLKRHSQSCAAFCACVGGISPLITVVNFQTQPVGQLRRTHVRP
jgi:hypothetical protein